MLLVDHSGSKKKRKKKDTQLPAWVGHNGVKPYPGEGHLAGIATSGAEGLRCFEAASDCAKDSEGGQIMVRDSLPRSRGEARGRSRWRPFVSAPASACWRPRLRLLGG